MLRTLQLQRQLLLFPQHFKTCAGKLGLQQHTRQSHFQLLSFTDCHVTPQLIQAMLMLHTGPWSQTTLDDLQSKHGMS